MMKTYSTLILTLLLTLGLGACDSKSEGDGTKNNDNKTSATPAEEDNKTEPGGAVAKTPESAAPAAEKKATPEAAKKEAFGMIQIPALADLNKKQGAVAIFDANSKSTREKMGVIPGAMLLEGYSSYDTAKLPAQKDTKLVFYCANERCSASHKAAERAASAGYSDVDVLPAGIKGWKESGQPTVTPADAKKL